MRGIVSLVHQRDTPTRHAGTVCHNALVTQNLIIDPCCVGISWLNQESHSHLHPVSIRLTGLLALIRTIPALALENLINIAGQAFLKFLGIGETACNGLFEDNPRSGTSTTAHG